MKPVDKKLLLKSLEAKVERHISDAIRHFQNLDNALLHEPSVIGGWSVAECLDHLNSYGLHYLPRIRSKMANACTDDVKQDFTGTWLGGYFTIMMDPDIGKNKYKAFKGHIPRFNLDAAHVVKEFISQQEDILDLLRMAASRDMESIKIPVSVIPVISLRLGDVFQFIIAHNDRHMLQAKRNLNVTPIVV